MQFNYSEKLAWSPAFTAVICAFADLLKRSQANPRFEFGNMAQVVYVTDDQDSKVIAASVFNVLPEGEGIIYLSFVNPEFRNNGIYKQMYEDVEQRLIAQGAQVIVSGAWVTNELMRNALISTGRAETSVRGTKWIHQQLPV